MRYPNAVEIEAVQRVRHMIAGWHFDLRSLEPRLLWAPTIGTYVVAVPYDPRLEYRLPSHVSATSTPYNPHTPQHVGLQPYAFAIPVVMVTMPPPAMNPKNPILSMGTQRPSTRYGTGFGFPSVWMGDAPVIDGVAYSTEDPQYCMNVDNPYMEPAKSLYFPVQPQTPCSQRTQ